MRRTLARITLTAAAVGFIASTQVRALGLGEIDVSSDLNQRFVASIPLTEISAEDLETVSVSVAPNEAFERAGIERAEYLSSLSFEIRNDRGRPRVIVTSSQIAREPVLDLLVQARWSGGKIQRDYTILLDPAEAVVATRAPPPSAPVVASAPVIAASSRPAPAPAPSRPVAPRPSAPVGGEFYQTPAEAMPGRKPAAAAKPAAVPRSAAEFDSSTGSYGPVVAKETLWSIATKVRPGSAVSMDQVILALAEANPVAIQRGTTVSKGATLRVPSAERMQSIPAATATIRLAGLRAGAPARPAAAAPKAAVAKPAVQPVPAPAPQAAAPPAVTSSAPIVAAKPAPAPVIAVAPEPPKATPPPPAAPVMPAAVPSPAAAAPQPATASIPAVTAPAPAAAPAAVGVAPGPQLAPAAVAGVGASAASSAGSPAEAAAAPPAASKSPLARPLPAQPENGFLDDYGPLLGFAALALLLAGGAFAFSRGRKATPVGKNFAQFKADTLKVMAPAGGAGAVGKLGDTTKLSDTQILGSPKVAAAMAADATQQMTQPLIENVSHQSTMILRPDAMAGLNKTINPAAVSPGADTFDRTTQVQVDTMHIDLADNDPLSEADFHLAYGLYDEAILLLKAASQQQPQRTDLKVKLAETYFAAGRPMEFQELAEDLKYRLTPAEWSKFAIMGAQICPDVALFQTADGGAGLAADFDLAFDDSATLEPVKETPGSVDFSLLDDEPATPAWATSLVSPTELQLTLERNLGNALKPDQGTLQPASQSNDASIDFMLSQSLTPLGSGMSLPAMNTRGFELGSPTLDIEIPKMETKKAAPPADRDDQLTLAPPGSSLSMSLQDLEVSITPRQGSAESLDDDLNTKLDLARAYVEMGDNDMARSLLQEVQKQGGARHQQEAASLLQRLPA